MSSSPTTATPAERRLEELASAHGPRVLAYLARRTDPPADAADVLQEVLTTAWRKIHHAPDDPDHAIAWLLAIARRASANHRRSAHRRHAATQRLRAELAAYPPLAQPTDPGGYAHDDVRTALATLGDGDRELLELTYWDGLTGEQVATVVGASPPATRKRIQRARDRLAAALADERATPPVDQARSTPTRGAVSVTT
ncbi:RNA polymerase sigma factor [Knoellia koreensis]|uniref:Sigma-70 family RNA polymerase sigma factor n=1 Tax=Knoellia koreensis TaxID=2730921 RepID=A0A849HKW4_9MICO|nr:sigma-70 family RNA polymerase sigma factor [Knoellia sp. DB2414S]NNM47313.1 sigma-70 family RNA polymerase sigma factor [Knoellia sp. DB2414S]